MLSSIGLGSVSALFQPSTTPVGGPAPSSSADKTKAGSSKGDTASDPGPVRAASAGGAAGYDTPKPSSSRAVSASQGVAPVGKSATDASTAYTRRGEPAHDSDRDLAAATQRRMFRAQLIDRIGQEPEGPSLAVKPAAGGQGSGLAARISETELSYSY